MPYSKIKSKCKGCGSQILMRPDQKYCCRSCYFDSRFGNNRSEIRSCLVCGEGFKVYLSQINAGWGKGKYCSRKCYYKAPKTEEFKQKISKAFRGKGHPNWKGGIMKGRKDRNLLEYKRWRMAVFMRDNWTCQFCEARSRVGLSKPVYLEAHHIKSWTKYPELRYKLNNGVTLCTDCHKLTRKKEAKANESKETEGKTN